MTLDSDLVVIGNTPEAVYAVLEAAKLEVCVAWVMGNNNNNYYTEIDRYTISYLTHLEQQWKITTQWDLVSDFSLSNFNPTHIKTWMQ